MIDNSFDELLLHRVKVTSGLSQDNYGRETYDNTTARTYMCLLTDSRTVGRTATETSSDISAVIYVKSIPIGDTNPVPISAYDKIEVIAPAGYPTLPVTDVITYPDTDGTDYCYEIRFGAGRVPRRG